MSTADWSQMDPSVPSIVTSSDLFDGELFGDELIDIYNSSSAEERCNPDDGNEIPTLLPPAPDMDGMSSKHHHHDDHHPGAQMAVAAAAMDDGLGAFRPSTSFNDLTSLLQSPAPAESVVKATTIVLVAPAVAAKSSSTTATTTATTTITTTTSKKRAAATNNAGAPAAKRRGGRTRSSGTTGGRRSTAKNAKANAVAAAAAATLAPPVAVVPKEVPSTIITTIAPACTTKTPVAAATTAVGQQRKNTRATARASPPNLLGAMVAKSSTPSALTVKLTAVKPCGPVPSAVVTPRVSPPINNRPSVSLTTAETNEAAATAAAVVAAAAAAVVAATNSAATAAAAAAAAEEEDFKTAAQAAVSNLILNGKSDDSVALEGTVASSSSSHIDTSTAHIQALTGSNWVTACGGGGGTSGGSVSGGAAEAAAACDDSKSQNRARRQNLTPDERARQNRDRNREHARNTRLRKKAYVEELKRTLTELVAQRDAAELDKKQSTQREMEQREVRFRVMEEFLKLRGRNEASVTRWAAILEEGFSLTLPMTDFRKMVQEDNHHNHNRDNNNNAVCLEQCLQGVGEVMADSVHVAAFLRSLRGDAEDHGTVTLAYHCERKDFFMDGCNTVLDWTATTVAARLLGASNGELTLKGTMRANFSPASNKLITAQIAFDTGSVVSQLQPFPRGSMGYGPADDSIVMNQAAFQADALLDSLQVPQLNNNSVPSAITVVPNSASSSSDNSNEGSSDESEGEHADG